MPSPANRVRGAVSSRSGAAPPGGTFTHVGTNIDGTTGSVPSFVLAYPDSAQAGDLCIGVCSVHDSDGTATVEANPNGFTAIGSNPYNGITNSFLSSAAYWKILDETDISIEFMSFNFNGFRSQIAGCTVWRPSGTVSLADFSNTNTISDGNPTPATVPSVTVTAANDLILLLGTFRQSTTTYQIPGDFTNRGTGVFGTHNMLVASKAAAAGGETGALDCSIQNDFFGNISWGVVFHST